MFIVYYLGSIYIYALLFFRKYPDVASFLLSQGADTDLRNLSGAHALHLASASGSLEICKLLFRRENVDVFCTDNDGTIIFFFTVTSQIISVYEYIYIHPCMYT